MTVEAIYHGVKEVEQRVLQNRLTAGFSPNLTYNEDLDQFEMVKEWYLKNCWWDSKLGKAVRISQRKPVDGTPSLLAKVVPFRRKISGFLLGGTPHLRFYSNTFGEHYHSRWVNPWTGELGFTEVLGVIATKLVTTTFRNYLIDNLVAEVAEFGDFKFHRVGTSGAAEVNTHTALTTDSQITGVTGTQVDATPVYRTVGVITADVTETWAEHAIFSQPGTTTPAGSMMDRNLLSPTLAVNSPDTATLTYELTVNAE